VAEGVRRIAVPHYLITESYTDQWIALPFRTYGGMGIPVFEDEQKAQEFINANWESLGPGWEPKNLRADQLAYVLERYSAEEGVQLVVLDPPSVPVASLVGTYDVEVAEIRPFIALLKDHLGEVTSQIVREAGITPSDPEEAGRRENDKARVDLWRIIAVLNIALLAGIGATRDFLDRPLPSSSYLLMVSVSLNLSGLLLALFALALASMVVGAGAGEEPASVASLRRWRERVGMAAYMGFGLSVLAFLVFVGNNLSALRP
jgi:hypothetical protein